MIKNVVSGLLYKSLIYWLECVIFEAGFKSYLKQTAVLVEERGVNIMVHIIGNCKDKVLNRIRKKQMK